MARASDIMNPQVVSIHPEASVEEAVKLFAENKVSGMPVTDNEQHVIGVISESDIFEYSRKLHVIPMMGFSGWVSPYTDVSKIASFKKGIDLLSSTKVQEIMSAKVVTVNKNTTWHEIVKLMKNSNINRLPVIDDEDKIIGIITRSDLLTYLADKDI